MRYSLFLGLILFLSAGLLKASPADSVGLKVKNGKVYVMHKVDPGETLSALSKRYGCSIPAILDANGIQGNSVKSGQLLLIPAKNVRANQPLNQYVQEQNKPAPAVKTTPPKPESPKPAAKPVTPAPAAKPAAAAQTEKPAAKPAAAPAKPVSPATKPAAEKPQNPPPKTNATPATPVKSAPVMKPGAQVHVVEQGQTLFAIARIYKVSVNAIKTENELVSDEIRAGQKLVIPSVAPKPEAMQPAVSATPAVPQKAQVQARPDSSGYHWTLPGETLFAISKQYAISVADMREWNALVSDDLKAGSWIRVRKPAQTEQTPAPEHEAEKNQPETVLKPAPAAEEAVVVPVKEKPKATDPARLYTPDEENAAPPSESRPAEEASPLKPAPAAEVPAVKKSVIPPGAVATPYIDPLSDRKAWKVTENGKAGVMEGDEKYRKKFYGCHALLAPGTLVRVENPATSQAVTVEIVRGLQAEDPCVIRLSEKARAYLLLEDKAESPVVLRYTIVEGR